MNDPELTFSESGTNLMAAGSETALDAGIRLIPVFTDVNPSTHPAQPPNSGDHRWSGGRRGGWRHGSRLARLGIMPRLPNFCGDGGLALNDIVAVTDDYQLRASPSDSAARIKNEKASPALGKAHYYQIDSSTTVRRLCVQQSWTEVQIVSPYCLTHVRGWVLNRALREIVRAPSGNRIFVAEDFIWDNDTSKFKPQISAGADIEARNKDGNTPLHEAARFGTPDNIAALVSACPDIEVRNKVGYTPLHVAAMFGTPDNIAALVKAGADLNAHENGGWTPLHLAAAGGTPSHIAALVSAGANIDARGTMIYAGQTALHAAASHGTPDNIAALLSAGADINARDNRGWTPLHYAAWEGTPDNIAALLEAGASGSAKDESGKTPFDLAQYNDRVRILFYLDGEITTIWDAAYWELKDAQYK